MQVLLINPRAQKAHRRLPLSVLFVARGIPAGTPWHILDANVTPGVQEEAERRIAAYPGRTLLLVTVMPGPQLRWAAPWCRSLRARFPDLFIVWGGYFPSVYPEAVAADPAIDLIALGQGEDTLREIVTTLTGGGDPAGLPGTAAWRDGRLLRGPDRPRRLSSSYGTPPYHRLDMETYAARTFLGARTYNHHSSVGCPYTCNFCAVTNLFEGRWLADRPADVITAVRHLHETWGADAVEFHDNNFFAAEARCREIAEGITGLGVSWWGEGRIDTMLAWSDATWEAMARSGLRMVFYGAESGDPEALAAMNKGGLVIDETRALNRRARSFGVIPEFSFVLGNPRDPASDIARSLELIRDLKAENPACEIILYLYTPVPLPGLYDEAQAQGFAFPTTLDEWLSPRWERYEDRRNPGTPWLTPGLVRQVHDFETVLHARWPTISDRHLRPWQRRVLRTLSAPRYRLGWTHRPVELKALQRLWRYRRPEEMGF